VISACVEIVFDNSDNRLPVSYYFITGRMCESKTLLRDACVNQSLHYKLCPSFSANLLDLSNLHPVLILLITCKQNGICVGDLIGTGNAVKYRNSTNKGK